MSDERIDLTRFAREDLEMLLPNADLTKLEPLISGIPKSVVGDRYRSAPALSLVEDESGHQFVCFGAVGAWLKMCASPDTGEVVEIFENRPRSARFVNSSLDLFTRTAAALADRLPLYSLDSPYEANNAAADDLARIFAAIDPRAMEQGQFWSTLVDDVRMGDFAEELILEWYQQAQL